MSVYSFMMKGNVSGKVINIGQIQKLVSVFP
jgi:hypothetical protein